VPAPFSDNLKIFRNGHEATVDSIVSNGDENLIYVDGFKTPVKKIKKSYTSPTPTPTPIDSTRIVQQKPESIDASVTVKKSNIWWSITPLIILGLVGVAIILLSIFGLKKKNSKNSEPSNSTLAAETNFAQSRNSRHSTPTTPTLLQEDNRMRIVNTVDPNYAPAYANMPKRNNLNPAALPSMLITAYTNQPVFINQYGAIAEVKNIRHGYLNGEFTMQHADGSVSRQKFVDEPGVRAKVTLKSGKTMFVYSRYSCLNDVRGIKIAEVLVQPTFTPETEVKVGKKATTTTVYRPESLVA